MLVHLAVFKTVGSLAGIEFDPHPLRYTHRKVLIIDLSCGTGTTLQ